MTYYKKKFNNDGPSAEDKALEKFTEMMIAKVRTLQSDWKKPWFTEGSMAWPKNMNGREYNGMNALILMLLCEKQGYKVPVFCTFDRVSALNYDKDKQGIRKPLVDENGEKLPLVSINKGEKSTPIFITTFTCIDKDTKSRINYDDYKLMSNEEKKNIDVYPKMKVYSVFNVSQTNLKETRPELYAKLEEQCKGQRRTGELEGKVMPAVEAMISDNGWYCPIKEVHGDNAYYSISRDEIVLPERGQFKDVEAFQTTLFHEVVHSTGREGRLGRIKQGSTFGSAEYAREELVAELSAALISSRYGMEKHVKEDSCAYLKSWLDSLKESPEFLKSTLLDVKRASSMITQRIDAIKERIEQGLAPIDPKIEATENIEHQRQKAEKEPIFYSSVQFLQMSEDTSRFDKLGASQILQEAREYDNGDSIDMENTYRVAEKYPGDNLIAEDDHYAIINNNQVGGTYDIMRKVSEKDIRDSIERYGLASNSTDDVKGVAKAMVAKEFSKMTDNRIPVFEMANGSILYIQYNQEKDTLELGNVTNVGMQVQMSFPYDHDFNLNGNIDGIHEKLTEMMVYHSEIAEENVSAKTPSSMNKQDEERENRNALDNFMTDFYWTARRENDFRMSGFEMYQGKEAIKLCNDVNVSTTSYYLISREPANISAGERDDKFFMHLYDPETKQEIFKSREMPHDKNDAYSFLRGAFKELQEYEYEKQANHEQVELKENVQYEQHFHRGR